MFPYPEGRSLRFRARLPWHGPPAGKHIPIGLELYSVRGELAKDPTGTVKAVAKMGYEVVEFYAPYFSWTLDQAKDMRKLLDDLGIRCNSTHNSSNVFVADGLPKAIDLNQILGAKYIVWASANRLTGLTAGRRWPISSAPYPPSSSRSVCGPAITTTRRSSWRSKASAPSRCWRPIRRRK